MKENYFHIVVKKLKKFRHKIVSVEKIKHIVHRILDEKYKDAKAYKMIHQLKNKGYIISIKKNMLLIKTPKDDYDEHTITEKFYRDVVRLHNKEKIGPHRYIGGLKALELNMYNYDIPDTIDIYTQDNKGTDVALLTKKIFYKTYTNKEKNLWNFFRTHTNKMRIQNRVFRVANRELSMIESLYNPSLLQEQYTNELVKKILKKYKKHLNTEVFVKVLRKGKHHASINRLYYLALHVDDTLAQKIKNIIKKEGYMLAK